MLYSTLKGVRTTHLRIDDDKSDCPVHGDCQRNEEKDACQEASLSKSIWLSYYAGAALKLSVRFQSLQNRAISHNAVGHIHKGAPHTALGASGLQ